MNHRIYFDNKLSLHRCLTNISLCLIGLLTLASAGAQVLVVHAAAGVKSPLESVAQAFKSSSGFSLDLHFDTAGAAQQRYLADDSAQVLITTLERIEASTQNGELKEGQLFPFAATVAGMAGKNFKANAPQNADELKHLLLNLSKHCDLRSCKGRHCWPAFHENIGSTGYSH